LLPRLKIQSYGGASGATFRQTWALQICL
jgi:hypothetical protein